MNGSNPMVSGMMRCPRCRGSTWADGKNCTMCSATGVIAANGEPVSYEDGMKFIDWLDEQQKGLGKRK